MPESAETLEALTDAAAAKPRAGSVSPESRSVNAQPIPDLIALENHRAHQRAAAQNTLGIRTFKTKPPGTV